MKTKRTLIAALAAVVLILAMAVPSLAAGAEYITTQQFLKVMDQEGHKYTLLGIDEDDDEHVRTSFSGDYMDTVTVNIFFDEDLDEVSFRCWDVIVFDEEDYWDVLWTVNDLNDYYKYVKFILDSSDNTVYTALDIPLRQGSESGEIAYDALEAIVIVTDYGYDDLLVYDVG